MGIRRRRLGVAAIASGVAAFIALGAGSAPAAEGDTFYLLSKKNTFVSFVVRASSGEASDLVYGARKIPCPDDPKGKFTAMGYNLRGSAPIVDGAFYLAWSPLTNDYGGIKGTRVRPNRAKGTLNLHSPDRTCSSGARKWTAKPVTEHRWESVRERRYGIDPNEPPPAG